VSDHPRVVALVLSYQGREVTLEALPSLTAQDYSSVDVVVVDNGSTDGTREAVESAYPDVRVLRRETNEGPAAGVNHGLSWAWDAGYDYLLVLNNDIEAGPEMVSELVAAAEADPTVGVVGPKTYYYWEREKIWSAGGILRYRESVTTERGEGEVDCGQYDQDQEVSYVNGCAMLIRRATLEVAGLWDPVYFLSVEDADFCRRVQAAGYRCWYAHRATLWHRVSSATGGYSPGRTFHTGRSTAIYLRRWASTWERWQSYAFVAATLPIAFLRELPRRNQGAVVAKAKGFWEGLRVELPSPPEPLSAGES